MPDFTFNTFRHLLTVLKEQKYTFQTFAQFLKNPAPRAIILRHDVDARKMNSLKTAKLEAGLGIRGTYNFRIVPQSFDRDVIRQIAGLGHEIGYHYEDLTMVKGNLEQAVKLFEQNLAMLRQIVPIETICMHGSPISKNDNRVLWEKFNYRDYGIIGEPYFDLNFSSILYLTDTGRRWDGERVSVRDKIADGRWKKEDGTIDNLQLTTNNIQHEFHSTFDIIKKAQAGKLADQIMINFHPQRWDDNPLPWFREYVMQNLKNVAKRILIGSREK